MSYLVIEESDDEILKEAAPVNPDKDKNYLVDQRVYLFVPYRYKDSAKKLGAKWDNDKRSWYTNKSNKHFDQLTNTYHDGNFSKNGEMTSAKYLRTLEEYKSGRDKVKEEKQERIKMKEDFIRDGGKAEDFGQWYSVNILGHE